ncbi:hypothetical protein HHX47_DHR3000778 [Lentinula edodes]|nr:hypothetical protein HHX47_DHR3000778 [Lentinula edodes]
MTCKSVNKCFRRHGTWDWFYVWCKYWSEQFSRKLSNQKRNITSFIPAYTSPHYSMSNPTPDPAPTTPVTTPHVHGKSLLREPNIFDGNKTQFKEWRCTLFAYICDPKNRVTIDNERIDIAILYMRGPKVSSWVQNYTDDNFDNDEEEWAITWKGFKDTLNASFLDKGLTENSQEKLEHLRQGPNERAEDFFKEFEVIMRDAEYAKDTPYIIRLIEMNVKPKLIDQVYGTSNEQIEKFEELKQKSISIDDMWWHREEM